MNVSPNTFPPHQHCFRVRAAGGGGGRELQLEAPVPCACPRVFFMIVYIGVFRPEISIVQCMFDISLGPYFRRRKAVPSSNETPICKKLGGKSLGDGKARFTTNSRYIHDVAAAVEWYFRCCSI